ncbi:hypothetical protein LZ32DRAFT_661014 [Colletotrichum eremochloae]|nr:hypothetical protein LZ32DRAFT_661014 [Colletotrichum eremochloae]
MHVPRTRMWLMQHLLDNLWRLEGPFCYQLGMCNGNPGGTRSCKQDACHGNPPAQDKTAPDAQNNNRDSQEMLREAIRQVRYRQAEAKEQQIRFNDWGRGAKDLPRTLRKEEERIRDLHLWIDEAHWRAFEAPNKYG